VSDTDTFRRWQDWRGSKMPVGDKDGMVAVSELRGAIERGDALAAELERVTAALREIAHYEEPWPQDPSDVYEHFQAVARAALAGGARAAQEDA
jgi:hypothetical protein